MTAVTILLIILTLLTLLALTLSCGAVTAWRRERLRTRLLTERLIVEGRIEALTAQTLQAMRRAAREHLATRGRP